VLARSRLLTRHFLQRLFDNDLISPHADAHLGATLGAAGLLSLSTFVTVLMGASYVMDPFPSPFRTAVHAVDDMFLFVTASMILLALVAVAAWDSLALDARDEAILGPLPLPRIAIVGSKLAAMAALAGGVTLALNGSPTIFHPGAMLAQFQASLFGAGRLFAAHLAATGAAGLFGFCTMLALREIVRAIAGGWWPAISTRLQALLLAALIATLLLVPGWMTRVASRLLPANGAVPVATLASPPMWFVGLHQELAGDFVVEATAKKALPRRLREAEADAMATYRAGQAANGPLASLALTAVGLSFVLALSAFLWNARRPAARPRMPLCRRSPGPHLEALIAPVVARAPAVRAGFAFGLRTLSRSPVHRAALAVGAAVAISAATIGLGHATGTGPDGPPAIALLVTQTLFIAALLAGAEQAARLPAHLPAGWLVQLAWPGDSRPYVTGVKRAIAAGVVVPGLVLLGAAQVPMLGASRTIAHVVFGTLIALIAIEARFVGSPALPLLTPYVTGSRVKLAPFYLMVAIVFAQIVARFERLALASLNGTLALTGILLAVWAGLAVLGHRRGAPRSDDLDVFSAPLDEATQLRL
jgi:hypothetical protein